MLFAFALSVTSLAAVLPNLSTAGGAGTIAYPDLISVIPTNGFGIVHPSPATKELDHTHIVYDAGAGPLDVQRTVDAGITLADTAPTAHRSNFAAVEIVRPISVPPPVATGGRERGDGDRDHRDECDDRVDDQCDRHRAGRVRRGATYGSTTVLRPVGVKIHSLGLTGLTAATTYHFAPADRAHRIGRG